MKPIDKNIVANRIYVVAVNAVLLFALLALVAFVPPAIVDFLRFARSHVSSVTDPRSTLPNYVGQPWAKMHFAEFMSLRSKYYDFVVWRREAFAGTTIHIDDRGYRRHSLKSDYDTAEVWLFGGSAMWGYGSRDSETIPADAERISGLRTFNFAEAGYVAHQSLNLLEKAYLDGGNPKYVVFYDGANDVAQKCMVGQSVYGTTYEVAIQNFVGLHSRQNAHSLSLRVLFPAIEAFQIVTQRFKSAPRVNGAKPNDSTFYECQRNPQKVHAIAAMLVADWTAAKTLVESHGGKFLPVLQPIAYLGSPNLTHLKSIIPYMGEHLKSVTDDVVLKKQYELVYAEIKKILAEQHLDYIDLTESLDGNERFYIDECHLSPNGNQVIARRLAAAFH